jgi:hypothetical protein
LRSSFKFDFFSSNCSFWAAENVVDDSLTNFRT